MALPMAAEPRLRARRSSAVLLAGVPVLDTALVAISRRRAGVSILTGGRDHLTHRLRHAPRQRRARSRSRSASPRPAWRRSPSAWSSSDEDSVVAAWSIWFVVATAAVVLLETPLLGARARAERPSTAPRRGAAAIRHGAAQPSGRRRSWSASLIAFIAVACGLSPFLYGFYDVSVWGPIALGLLAALLGLVIARPGRAAPAGAGCGGRAGRFWLWALLSIGWAESADQALIEANRWLLYAALFGVLVLLLRDDRLGTLVIGGGARRRSSRSAATSRSACSPAAATELFLGGRLNEPLGYINGQAGYLLLGIWPLLALAERPDIPCLPAAGWRERRSGRPRPARPDPGGRARRRALAALLLVVAVPGRTRRGWALVVAGVGVAACSGPPRRVRLGARLRGPPEDAELRDRRPRHPARRRRRRRALGRCHRRGSRPARDPRCPACAGVAWVPLALAAVVALVVAAAALDDPVDKVASRVRRLHRSSRASRTRRRASPPAAATATTTGGSPPTSSPTTRSAGSGPATTTAPTSSSAARARTSASRTASSCRRLASSGSSGAAPARGLPGRDAAGLRAASARGRERPAGARARGGRGRRRFVGLAGAHERRLAPPDSRVSPASRCARRPCSSARGLDRARRAAGKAGVAIVAVCGLVVLVGRGPRGTGRAGRPLPQRGTRRRWRSNPAEAIAKAKDSQRLNDEAPARPTTSSRPRWARLGDYPRARAALDRGHAPRAA